MEEGTKAMKPKMKSEARAVGQGHARSVGAVELPELGERVVGEAEEFETDETLLGSGRGGFFAGAGDKFSDGFFTHGGFSGVGQGDAAIGALRDETGGARPSVTPLNFSVRGTSRGG